MTTQDPRWLVCIVSALIAVHSGIRSYHVVPFRSPDCWRDRLQHQLSPAWSSTTWTKEGMTDAMTTLQAA